MQTSSGIPYVGLPRGKSVETVQTAEYFQALENFNRTFCFTGEDRVVFLADRGIDPKVIHAICGLARARGTEPMVVMSHTTQHTEIPGEIKPLLEGATFVISTWFCSIIDPLCIALRKGGQRWVKITYFRDLELLKTPQARFPIDIVGEIIRQTAALYPEGQAFDLRFTCPQGSDLRIKFTPEMRANLLRSNRWRGQMTPNEPGAYVHYLPTHGPNLYDRTAFDNDDSVVAEIDGVVIPQWAVGFEKPFDERFEVVFARDRIAAVRGDGDLAALFRDMLTDGQLIELGCGFNPKAPRYTVYPAGSNSPGALHWGIDLARPSDYIRRVMPEWEEPPVHMDLISYNMTVTAGNTTLIDGGFLKSLEAPSVVEMASRYGDPVDLLQNWPD